MTRQTSIDAYNEIKEKGLLSKRRFQVYKVLHDFGPLTIREVGEKLPLIHESSLSPRFAELEKSGAIITKKKRPCTITGHTVHVWELTGNIPVKSIKPKKQKCPHCKGRGYLMQESLL